MKKYEVKIGDVEYPYYLSKDLDEIITMMIDNIDSDKYILIYDHSLSSDLILQIKSSIKNNLKATFIPLNISESEKNFDTLKGVIEKILTNGITRESTIVAIGGGVLGNLVGLASSLIYRGIRLIHLPTTIMSSTDSVLSLKQAINSDYGKNIIGAFYKPEAIFVSYSFFRTLSKSDYNSGLVEFIKNLLTIIPKEIDNFYNNINLFGLYSFEMFKYILEYSIKAKCTVLDNDKYEKGKGIILEYGHTIGHAIELVSKGDIKHGEGVAFGMLVEAEISRQLGFLDDGEVFTHYKLLKDINIIKQLEHICKYNFEEVIDVLELDNKKGYIPPETGKIAITLLRSIGENIYTDRFPVVLVEKGVIKENMQKVMNKIKEIQNNEESIK